MPVFWKYKHDRLRALICNCVISLSYQYFFVIKFFLNFTFYIFFCSFNLDFGDLVKCCINRGMFFTIKHLGWVWSERKISTHLGWSVEAIYKICQMQDGFITRLGVNVTVCKWLRSSNRRCCVAGGGGVGRHEGNPSHSITLRLALC